MFDFCFVAVVERLHGYDWKRLFLLVLFLFLAMAVQLLFMSLPSQSFVNSLNTTNCPGVFKLPYVVLPSCEVNYSQLGH